MAEVNAYLHAHYHPVDTVAGPWGHVEVMKSNSPAPVP
jgi:hypothetical protein